MSYLLMKVGSNLPKNTERLVHMWRVLLSALLYHSIIAILNKTHSDR